MAKKRSTKATRVAAEKAKLRQRLLDFAIGANSGFEPAFEDGDYRIWDMGAEAFSRFLRSIEVQMLSDKVGYISKAHNLDHFKTLDSAVDFLCANGVRHDSTPEDNT